MNNVINKFTKKQWAVFAVALVCTCLFTATTVYAAGDVSTAITSTWNSAKSQIKTVVNNVVFLLSIQFSPFFSLLKSAQRILITENTVNLNLRLLLFFLLV